MIFPVLQVTRNYAIIMDLPLMFDPQVMVSLGKLPFVYDKARGARFGVIRRDSCDSASIQARRRRATRRSPPSSLCYSPCYSLCYSLALSARQLFDSHAWQQSGVR